MSTTQTQLAIQRRFVGLDMYHPPQDLGEGYLQQADNLLVDGGELVTRPGKQGVWTAPLGAGLYAPLAYIKADNTTNILFASGGTSSGQIYQWVKGAASPVTVTGTPATLNAPNVQMARVGKYVYPVDGTSPLYRVDITSGNVATSASVTALNIPGTGPSAAGANTAIDSFNTAAGWSADYLASNANMLDNAGGRPDGTFASLSNLNTVQSGWTPDSLDGSIDLEVGNFDANYPSDKYLRLDDRGDQIHSTIAIANPALANDAARHAKHFHFRCRYRASFYDDGLDVTLYAYSDAGGTALLATRAITFTATAVNNSGQWEGILNFSDLDTEILSYRIYIRAGTNVHPGNNGPYIGSLFLSPVVGNDTAGSSAAAFTLANGQVAVEARPAWSSSSAPVGSMHLTKTVSYNGGDWSGLSAITLAVKPLAAYTGLRFKLGIRNGTGIAYTNEALPSADTSYYSVDLSLLSVAQRTGVTSLDIVFLADLTVTSGLTTALFALGPLSSAGNLSIGVASYYYAITEVYDPSGTGVDIIESDPSPLSLAYTATQLQAQATIGLPALTNGTATHRYLYRLGGVFSDGVGRLIAKIAVATTTYTDNTADLTLLATNATTMQYGRGAPPVGAQAVAEWQGRLWLAKGSTLYGSWLVTESNASALYFNSVNIPDDPYGAIKGVQLPIGGADNDPIQQLIPFGGTLIILKQRSVWVLTGFDASDFRLSSYLVNAGIGCVAPRAVAVVGAKIWFLGSDGVYEFDGDLPDPKSLPIEDALNPQMAGGTALQASAYGKASMLWAGRRLYLFAPQTSSDTANTCAYVWDSRQDGWTRYLQMNASGGVTLGAGTDAAEIYLAGLDGMLYQLTGAGDKSVSGASATAVSFAVMSRGIGSEAAREGYWRETLPTHVRAVLTTGESTSPAFGVTAAGSLSSFSQTYTVNGRFTVKIPCTGDVRGDYLTVSLSGSTVTRTRITALGAQYTEGRDG